MTDDARDTEGGIGMLLGWMVVLMIVIGVLIAALSYKVGKGDGEAAAKVCTPVANIGGWYGVDPSDYYPLSHDAQRWAIRYAGELQEPGLSALQRRTLIGFVREQVNQIVEVDHAQYEAAKAAGYRQECF